jgi:AraC-like DNA-binding protein
MDKMRGHIKAIVEEISVLPEAPISYAEVNAMRVLQTPPLPLVEFYLVTGGQIPLTVGGKTVVVRHGQMALANAHFGNYGVLRNDACRYSCVSFRLSSREMRERFAKEPLLMVVQAPDPSLPALYTVIAQLLHSPERPFRAELLKAESLRFLVAVHASIGRRHSDGITGLSRIDTALRLVAESSADAKISLGQLACSASLSPSRFIRVFKAQLGVTPMQYLMRLRINRSKRLLANTDLSVKEAALTVGFEDQLYFSRVFKKETGATPSLWRARSQSRGLQKD